MAVLGKDLMYISPNFFEFTALFADDGLEIFEKGYRYGELTTAFLNYDPLEYKTVTDSMKAACDLNDDRYAELRADADTLISKMPLFSDFSRGRKLCLKNALPEDYFALAEDLTLIHDRYAWFLTEIFYRDFGKQRTNRYAMQIEENGMSAFVSGRSLGTHHDVDPAPAAVQYEVRESIATGKPQLFEKMVFTRLGDFIYTELFKGMMHGSIPKQCKNCRRWFLRGPGFSYEYCDNIAPGASDKTCREIGALSSFREKTKNNAVWEIHQRAYKKYYARALKKKMSKADFNAWAIEAEGLRDKVLPLYASALNRREEYALDSYAAELNKL
jgi:hypothetical protein